MRFTFRQLEYFIAAGEAGSITLASERINISQPSISTAIAHLEQEIGGKLFVRHHALGLSLTKAGRVLLVEAKRVIDQAQSLYATASEVNEQIRGSLVVGCLTTLAPMILPELMHSFTATYPDVVIKHIGTDQERLLGGLRDAQIDIAVTYDLYMAEEISFAPLTKLPIHVVVGEKHPLAARREVSLRELVDEPLLLLDLPMSREYFLAMFMKEGLRPRIGTRSEHQDVIRTMVANGYGYTLANVRPRSDLALDGRRVVHVRLSGDHQPMVLGTAILGELPASRLISVFQDHCRACISEASIPGMIGGTLG
ncbi:LysR family transcriptional regulator [Aminobacter anthyllidis]|uniref:LysR family transcriptional regulator n=1 Tax=Aminobacter anthyllidis TaxID=1035067 RepID=A0A9X1D8V8_9HYPH|nr:LysR family transcriptional regulator [Aminobacter anthyllidis]MBT1159676.1 LysR family transcriptional regulator [Aminobacter anthyllidis]